MMENEAGKIVKQLQKIPAKRGVRDVLIDLLPMFLRSLPEGESFGLMCGI